MELNLMDTVRGYLTPDLIDKASNQLGEPSSGLRKAFAAGVPSILAMFVSRAEKGDAQGLLNDANEVADSNMINNPQELVSGGGFRSLLSGGLDRLQGMLGGNSGGIVAAISRFAGIKTGAAQGVLSLLGPITLGALGKQAKEHHLTAQGLSSYLAEQKASITSALPAGLSLDQLNDRSPNVHSQASSARTHGSYQPEVHDKKKAAWWPWLLLGLAAVALIWWFSQRGDNRNETVTTNTGLQAPATMPMSGDVQTTRLKLNNGVEINAYKGGVEDQLVSCLDDANCAAGSDKWFDFDNLNFETGSAQLTSSSMAQVQNIAAILDAYPNARIKIGGYTDNSGNAATNQTLSQQRAEAVREAITSAGANSSQITGAEGYGSKFAKAAATASDEERRKDRRIAVQLNAK